MKQLTNSARPGLRALAEQARLSVGAGVDGHTIAFSLAPRLNAPGRLGDPRLALSLLLERDANRARDLAASVEAVKRERQQIQAQILEQAVEQIRNNGFDRDPALVLGDQGWHPGVVGIVASQLVELYGKPTIVVAFDGEKGRGSVRGPDHVSVYELLVASEDEQVAFGGHHAAAGVTLQSRASLERLRDKFCAAALEHDRSSPPVESRVEAEVLLDPRARGAAQVYPDVEAVGMVEILHHVQAEGQKLLETQQFLVGKVPQIRHVAVGDDEEMAAVVGVFVHHDESPFPAHKDEIFFVLLGRAVQAVAKDTPVFRFRIDVGHAPRGP
jgi:hypothetical protein